MTQLEYLQLTRQLTIECLILDMHDMMLHPGEQARVVATRLVERQDPGITQVSHNCSNAVTALEQMGRLKW